MQPRPAGCRALTARPYTIMMPPNVTGSLHGCADVYLKILIRFERMRRSCCVVAAWHRSPSR